MDIPLDEVIYVEGIASSSTGAAADADSTPTFAVYEEATDTDIGVGGNMTKRTSLTGDYRASFTASAANGFEVGKWYAVIGSATIGGIACKGVLSRFRIVAAEATAGYPVANTTHWGGTAVASANVLIDGAITAAKIAADAITAAKIADGAIDAATFAAGAINAAAIASDAITDAKVAADVTIASVTGAVGSVTGNVGGSVASVTAGVTLADGAITAAKIATDAIDADAIASDAVTEIQSGLATAANLATVAGYLDTEIAAILADTNELQTDWADGGRLDNILDARASQASVDDVPTNAELTTALGGLNDLSAAEVNAEVDAAIETYHLDHLLAADYDPANKPGVSTALLNELIESDGGVSRFTANALEQGPGGGSAPTVQQIVDGVWDEDLADHQDAGSTGEALQAASEGGVSTISDDDKQDIAVLAAQAMEGVRVGVSFPAWAGGFRRMIQGDDFLNSNGTAIAWSMTGATAVASFSGWSVKMKVSVDGESAEQAGTITDATGDTRAGYIDWENFCADLPLGKGTYQFMFTDASSKEITLIEGKIELIERIEVTA